MDPSSIYGISNGVVGAPQNPMSLTGTKNMEVFKKELKMPVISNLNKPQTAQILAGST
jgi:hypothetical protein